MISYLDDNTNKELKLSMKSLIEDDTCFHRRMNIRRRSKSAHGSSETELSETRETMPGNVSKFREQMLI